MELLDRTTFREKVFSRDSGKCVVCAKPAADAHHIVERRLFDDGGYYLDNGASLCAEHHLLAEQTVVSCQELRDKIGITRAVLPEQLDADCEWDKWGNQILPDGTRTRGELFYNESVQRVLRNAVVSVQFRPYSKFPRTFHLPWSLGRSGDDRVLASVEQFVGYEVVVTEKVDGEATTIYFDGKVHARSVDSSGHVSRTRVKRMASEVSWKLPPGWRVCGENLQAVHSIKYSSLPGFFLVYAIFDEKNNCLSWVETLEWTELLELEVVPVLYQGIWDRDEIDRCFSGSSLLGGEQEGYVVRIVDRFSYGQWRKLTGKFVRPDHIRTIQHNWLRQSITENQLAHTMEPARKDG